jgi:hypothetical protein
MKDLNKYTLRIKNKELEEMYVTSQYSKIVYALIALTSIRYALFLFALVLILVYWSLPSIQSTYKQYFIG